MFPKPFRIQTENYHSQTHSRSSGSPHLFFSSSVFEFFHYGKLKFGSLSERVPEHLGSSKKWKGEKLTTHRHCGCKDSLWGRFFSFFKKKESPGTVPELFGSRNWKAEKLPSQRHSESSDSPRQGCFSVSSNCI